MFMIKKRTIDFNAVIVSYSENVLINKKCQVIAIDNILLDYRVALQVLIYISIYVLVCNITGLC